MADPRFFPLAGPFSLSTLAEVAQAEVAADADPSAAFEDVAPLHVAGPHTVSFLDNKKYIGAFTESRAGACIVHPDLAGRAPAGMALLLTPEPYRAYARVAAAFHPTPAVEPGVHPAAVVDSSAVMGEGVRVDAGAVIGARAEIGAATHIGPNAVIGDGVVIGAHCVVGANASISHTITGSGVLIYPGCRIGQDGFGFAMGAKGHLKVPQLGRVIIGDDVEIGANTTIDRGAGPDTVIGSGCRIDNLVQIGHNVQLGRGCVLVAQSGVAGSSKLGDFVVLGGQVGVSGHVSVGSGAQIAAQAGVMREVEPGGVVMGYPAKPIKEFWREVAAVKQLAARKGK
ncbi:UDP-3-O-[3-hydroxymyristoyl] glucosamine N-acyltransferase [Caenispirillum salinarum AK4]|uniref:UDP-3-O-acylglucosamine N-acyltransferase n=1 Tax=Caenispirillum salinarum AK4 TaxID=1238182 RepID=K9HQV0_9PROT|nr:UDP-3-O-(3-hydroxymyristoyl)glucosamine N-acyltransferase [Caenispirillum salinarum]EKV30816.1 UDP-3-O-[3-hydroxymyristoyl] glucosamine N-acyltransferase [Caenispirillum salinarum AK4]